MTLRWLVGFVTSIALILPGSAFATLADVCAQHMIFKADDGPCPKEFPFMTKKKSCVNACKDATTMAVLARIQCDQLAGQDAQLIAQGEKEAQAAADNTQQKQNSNETSNAENMTAGQQIQEQRKALANQVPQIMLMCIMMALKCDKEGGEGNPPLLSCKAAMDAAMREAENLGSAAKQMNTKSDKSTTNSNKLDKITGSPEVKTDVLDGTTGSSDISLSQLDKVQGSDITTSDASGKKALYTAGASTSSNNPLKDSNSSQSGQNALGKKSLFASSGSSSGAGGAAFGSTPGEDPNGALLGLDGSLDSNYEVSMAGGKQLSSGSAESAASALLAGLGGSEVGVPGGGNSKMPNKGGADGGASAGGKGGFQRNLAGENSANSKLSDSALSIFHMVRTRYHKLHSIGEI